MEYFDSNFTQQLAPLVAVVLNPEHNLQLFQKHLDQANISGKVWDNVILRNRLLNNKYCFKYFDNGKAILNSIASYKNKTQSRAIHSRLSPFNAQSDLFPNGLLSAKWLEKYTQHYPSAVICSFKLSSNTTDDEAMGLQLTAQRENYAAFGVKFIAVVVSDSDDDSTVDRIAQLRQVSGLPRSSGLFHLSLSSSVSGGKSTYDRDVEILASTILSTLKSACTDFYFAIEHRVEQREKKFYTYPDSLLVNTEIKLTPSLLETRNSIKSAMLTQLIHSYNIEGALPIIEQAYAGLFTLLKENITIFESKSASHHDIDLCKQWRTLLDVLALHLIRGYFSIEEPIAALRKLETHIRNLNQLRNDKLQIKIQTALQYHWLADLMTQIPHTVLQDLYGGSLDKIPNTRSVFFGGMAFHDSFHCTIVTVPSLIYARAAGCLNDVEPTRGLLFSSKAELLTYALKLLRTSKQLLKETNEPLVRFEQYLTWKIADTLADLGDIEGAEDHYKKILAKKSTIPKFLIEQVLQRRLALFQKKGDMENLIKAAVELAILGSHDVRPYLKNLSGQYNVEPEIPPVLEIEPLLYSENANEVFVMSKVMTQLKINSKSWLGALILGGLVLENFFVSTLRVKCKNGLIVSFTGDCQQSGILQRITEDAFDGSNLKNGLIVVQYDLVLKSSGWHEIESVEVEVEFSLKSQNYQLDCKHTEKHEFTNLGLQNSALIFEENSHGSITTKAKSLHGRAKNKIYIEPYRPELNACCILPTEKPVLEEKMDFLVKFSRESLPAPEMSFQEITVEVKSTVYENGEPTSNFYVQHNWDGLKDDLPLDILQFICSQDLKILKVLHASVRRAHGALIPEKVQLKANLEFRLTISELASVVSTFKLALVILEPLTLPFGAIINVSPRNPNLLNLLPNPFVLGITPEDYSMPQPLRLWLSKMKIVDSENLVTDGDIEIESAQLITKTKSSEIVVEWDSPIEQRNMNFYQTFAVHAKTHVTQSTIPIMVQGVITWKRKGGDQSYIFTTKDEDFMVSVQEPRVFLEAQIVEKDVMQLTYTLENPTPRILTFSANLMTERAALHGVSWSFNDYRNLVPLKQAAFPVLPFSLHNLCFYGTYRIHGQQNVIELPKLAVQDMNYKVELRTLALQENIKTVDQSLIFETI